MSRLLVTNKSFELLEPYEGKLSRTVLRGESSRKGADLLDIFACRPFFIDFTGLWPEKTRNRGLRLSI